MARSVIITHTRTHKSRAFQGKGKIYVNSTACDVTLFHILFSITGRPTSDGTWSRVLEEWKARQLGSTVELREWSCVNKSTFSLIDEAGENKAKRSSQTWLCLFSARDRKLFDVEKTKTCHQFFQFRFTQTKREGLTCNQAKEKTRIESEGLEKDIIHFFFNLQTGYKEERDKKSVR